ncbi:hypothetical protein WG66_009792 [Moniliophthora roreri]|nr:hypothetical protein WG66_009792 [Moniliophthora roreri]
MKRLDFGWGGDNGVDLLVWRTKYVTSGLFDLFGPDPRSKQGTDLPKNRTFGLLGQKATYGPKKAGKRQ